MNKNKNKKKWAFYFWRMVHSDAKDGGRGARSGGRGRIARGNNENLGREARTVDRPQVEHVDGSRYTEVMRNEESGRTQEVRDGQNRGASFMSLQAQRTRPLGNQPAAMEVLAQAEAIHPSYRVDDDEDRITIEELDEDAEIPPPQHNDQYPTSILRRPNSHQHVQPSQNHAIVLHPEEMERVTIQTSQPNDDQEVSPIRGLNPGLSSIQPTK